MKRRKFLKTAGMVAGGARVAMPWQGSREEEPAKNLPNIVYILCDTSGHNP